MPKALAVNKHALFSTILMIIIGLVATACNAVSGPVDPITVINAPLNNAQFREGDQVTVQSTSTDQSGIVRVELSVDSNVVRTDPLPKSQTMAVIVQTWTATPGTHTITVRAVNTSDVASAPASIAISVAPVSPAVLVITATPIPPVQVVTVTPAPSTCVNNSALVADVTVPDGTVFAPGQTFNKIWRVRNTGTCTWGVGDELVFVAGALMTTVKLIAVPATAPGATADLLVALTAPATPGKHLGEWRLRSKSGVFFGTTLNVLINVAGPTPNPCPFTPVIESFSASPATIRPGQSSILSWGRVIGAESAEIDNGIGGVATPGNTTVSPATTTTYTMTATCGSKVRTAQVTITVVTQP